MTVLKLSQYPVSKGLRQVFHRLTKPEINRPLKYSSNTKSHGYYMAWNEQTLFAIHLPWSNSVNLTITNELVKLPFSCVNILSWLLDCKEIFFFYVIRISKNILINMSSSIVSFAYEFQGMFSEQQDFIRVSGHFNIKHRLATKDESYSQLLNDGTKMHLFERLPPNPPPIRVPRAVDYHTPPSTGQTKPNFFCSSWWSMHSFSQSKLIKFRHKYSQNACPSNK